MKIDLFHFGDCGAMDESNPFFYYRKEKISELLYLIASNKAYFFDLNNVAHFVDLSTDVLEKNINDLLKIGMLKESNSKLAINFPVFLKEDIPFLEEISASFANRISELLVVEKAKLLRILNKMEISLKFEPERIFYHLIGDRILDGSALDYFAEKGLFINSKQQIDNRNYLLIGYGNSKEISKLSNKLLCSSNNIQSGPYVFNSFGDADGERKDFYRFFRQCKTALDTASENKKINRIYNKINDDFNLNLLKKLGKIIEEKDSKNEIDKEYLRFLEEIGYLAVVKEKIELKIPVFTQEDLRYQKELHKAVLDIIEEPIHYIFKEKNDFLNNLTAKKHDVTDEEILNEIWHLIFGKINELLVEKSFFAKPEYIKGEGRYFQALYIFN